MLLLDTQSHLMTSWLIWVLVKCCSFITSWRYWLQLLLFDSIWGTGVFILKQPKCQEMLPEITSNIKHVQYSTYNICMSIYTYVYVHPLLFSPLCLFLLPLFMQADVRCVFGMEQYYIERSDLFRLHTIHLFSSPWQFSLGTGFNIGQNAICIYISFFIRLCSLSPLKTLRIWWKSVAANFK